MAISENSKKVITFLRENADKDLIAADVAAALDLGVKTVNACFTASIQNKEYGYREEAQVQDETGKYVNVKFLRLNDAGMSFDLDD